MEISIKLTDADKDIINDVIATGQFNSMSEVIRAGLDKLKHDLAMEKLKNKLQKAEKSPVTNNFEMDKFLNRIHHKMKEV